MAVLIIEKFLGKAEIQQDYQGRERPTNNIIY
jgi:hypothetical protein